MQRLKNLANQVQANKIHSTSLLRASFSSSKASYPEGTKKPSLENIRKGWDAWAIKYATMLEKHNLPPQLTLADLMNLGPNDRILEMACGSGYFLSQFLLNTRPKEYRAFDLSPNMVALTQKRLSHSLQQGRLIDDIVQESIPQDSKTPPLKGTQLSIEQGNAENLASIASNSMDAYIGGIFIHLVPDPAPVLKEAFRVLTSGGRVGFSVFGDHQKSKYFSLFDDLVKQEGHQEFRSKFYLSDTTLLRRLCEEAGFKNIRLLRQTMYMGVENSSQADEHFSMPANRAILRQFPAETQERLKTTLRDQYAQTLASGHVGCEVIIVDAVKP